MATVTDDGLVWYHERTIGDAGGAIDEIALGTGEGSESQTATGLTNQIYLGNVADNNIRFQTIDDTPTKMEAIITVRGGTEVPSGAQITEFGISVSEENVLIALDNFLPVEVEAGHTEEFTMPVELGR
jgi:hypothetical protein